MNDEAEIYGLIPVFPITIKSPLSIKKAPIPMSIH
jgi:hypothetical protein